MSPARIGRPSEASLSPLSSHALIVSAMRSARRVAGAPTASSSSGDQASAGVARRAVSVGQISTRPAWPDALDAVADDVAVGRRPGVRMRRRTRGRRRRAPARRCGTTGRAALAPAPAPALSASRPKRCAHLGEHLAARRPGSCRSTASRRRRRTACAPPRAAPLPEKNSCASASMICHCSGLVSCASSTRMWSRPPSSL